MWQVVYFVEKTPYGCVLCLEEGVKLWKNCKKNGVGMKIREAKSASWWVLQLLRSGCFHNTCHHHHHHVAVSELHHLSACSQNTANSLMFLPTFCPYIYIYSRLPPPPSFLSCRSMKLRYFEACLVPNYPTTFICPLAVRSETPATCTLLGDQSNRTRFCSGKQTNGLYLRLTNGTVYGWAVVGK
jgi:hypothetical protein